LRELLYTLINSGTGSEIHPEFLLWATCSAGISATQKNYQTLETYGDTILKIAGTVLGYFYLQRVD